MVSAERVVLLMAGLVGAGKTSFLAALWHALESAERPGEVRLRQKPNNPSYLNRIREKWIQGGSTGRTQLGAEATLELDLLLPDGRSFVLSIADLAGERFRDLWNRSVWHEELAAAVATTAGILLFVHATDIVRPIRVDAANAILASMQRAPDGAPKAEMGSATPLFDPVKHGCTAARVAHIMEAVRSRTGRIIPTALVVSAWDEVTEPESPLGWLKSALPLLWQMVTARGEEFPVAVFGVSALGGDITDSSKRSKMLALMHPSQRIRVVSATEESHDITAPIAWLAREVLR